MEDLLESLVCWQSAILGNEPLTIANRLELYKVLRSCEQILRGSLNEEEHMEAMP